MGKHILLIGVTAGELVAKFTENSPAIANVTALQNTLLSNIDGLREDHVTTLINPNLRQMRHALALMTYRCRHDDLCLVYYTGCGVMDPETGRLYLPASDTQLNAITTTAISSDYIRQALPSLQEDLNRVMVLDCLWTSLPQTSSQTDKITDSPSLPQQAIGPDHYLSIPYLADCNCALLTALASAANPWPITDLGLTLYTHCLVEGITTGLADTDADGGLSIDDLQTYMTQTLGDAEIFPVALHVSHTHANIPLLPIHPYSPEREYRRTFEDYARRHQGYIPPNCQNVLEFLRHQLGITTAQSQAIETEVMAPYAQHQENCDRYRQALLTALTLENPLEQPLKKWLRHLQGELALSYEDIAIIEAQIREPQIHESLTQLQTLPQWLTPTNQRPKLPAQSPNGHSNTHHYKD